MGKTLFVPRLVSKSGLNAPPEIRGVITIPCLQNTQNRANFKYCGSNERSPTITGIQLSNIWIDFWKEGDKAIDHPDDAS